MCRSNEHFITNKIINTLFDCLVCSVFWWIIIYLLNHNSGGTYFTCWWYKIVKENEDFKQVTTTICSWWKTLKLLIFLYLLSAFLCFVAILPSLTSWLMFTYNTLCMFKLSFKKSSTLSFTYKYFFSWYSIHLMIVFYIFCQPGKIQ